MYKVFVNNKALFIASNTVFFKAFAQSERYEFSEIDDWVDFVDDFEKSEKSQVLVYHSDVAEIWRSFVSGFVFIEAAGGLVRNAKNDLLVIRRLGVWDLPKGKLEDGETIKEAAVREVEEECGVSALEITGEAILMYHTYKMRGKSFLKRTYWYPMQTTAKDELVPQTEEDITDVQWWPQERMQEIIDDTYSSIASLLREDMD